MTHTRQMDESEGTFQTARAAPEVECRKCKKKGLVRTMLWESHCGSYEDTLFHCIECGFEWWVDGIDS